MMRPYILALAVFLLPSALQAQVTQRTTVTTIIPGAAADFSGASFIYNNVFDVPNFTGSFSNNFSIVAGAENIYTQGFQGVSTSPGGVPDGSATYPFTVTGTGLPGGTYELGYTGGATGFLTPMIIGGRYALAFSGGGTNGVDIGGVFNTTVRIAGNWSNPARHTAATFDPAYTLGQNFTYSGGLTSFSLTNANFQGGTPGISFALLGSRVGAVPEPSSWALLILGFGAIGGSLRRARRTTALRMVPHTT